MTWEAKAVLERPNLAIGFLSAFGCLFLVSLRGAYFMTFHLFFTAVGNALDVSILGKHPLGTVANLFLHADNTIMRWIGEGISRTQHAAVEMIVWIAYQVTMIGVAIAAIGYELGLQGVRLLERTALPHIKPIVKTVTHEVTATVTRVRVIADSRVPALAREVKALEAKLAHVASSIALPAPVTIPREIPKVGQLEDAWGWTRAKVGRLAGLGTVAGLIGLTAAVLARLGLGWLRCSKVKRVGRQLCGMNDDLLGALLMDATLIVGTVSLVELAEYMVSVTEELQKGILLGFRETRDLV